MRNFEFSQSLDRDFLNSVYEDDPGYAVEIFESFVEALPTGLKELEEKYQEGDITGFRSVAHRLKPSFSYVGLTGITNQMAILEKSCLEIQRLEESAVLYRQVLQEIEAGFPHIKEELIRLKAYIQLEEKS